MLAVLAAPLLGASAVKATAPAALDDRLQQALAEQMAAERRQSRLEQSAAKARTRATRLQRRQAAAAAGIAATEAGISAAEARLKIASSFLARHRAQLEAERRPVASLLAGLAMLGQRPPIIALADRGGAEEMVRMKVLIDSTMPTIRRRSAQLSAMVEAGEELERKNASARAALIGDLRELDRKKRQFAALEAEASAAAIRAGAAAIGAGDWVLAGRERLGRIESSASRDRVGRSLAADLASGPALPDPPNGGVGPSEGGGRRGPGKAGLSYRLPVNAQVARGMGEVSISGIRARGVLFETRRGTAIFAPAAGTVRFSGPFASHDGVVAIDHGGGWISLIVNLASPLGPGAKVRAGQPVGRALGPIEVELTQDGTYRSPAIIAGSSATLSNAGEGR